MLILPAIDLYEGKAVRLAKGDYARMTVYNDDPVAVAHGFKLAGATAVHVVDLEGARNGEPANFGVIERIARESGLEVRIGGGVRTADTVKRYLDIGVKIVILGTAAVTTPDFVSDMTRIFGGAVAVSIDIRDGRAAIKGWTETSELDALDFCRAIEDLGIKTIVCTDISKDGMLGGTNMELYRTIRQNVSVDLVASGGITTLGEIRGLSALGMNAAILGRAIYTGDLDLKEAISAAGEGVAK